ncbi:glycosyltransferase family 2 protein [Rhodobacteraceae bacterium CCMM004]|nr:glycosyltransferase family 2 protein [Rhodobacteraceae bacterium CCMM004]
MMKDEGPYLLEWVAHHLAVGFTDLLVYTNDCTDGTDDMLIRLEALGLAHHRRNVIAPGIKPQPSAIRHAQADPLVAAADWVMVFDADEFLSIRLGDGSLDGLLDAVVAAGGTGIVVTWRIFGSSGIVEWSRDFVTEQFLHAAPPMWNKGWGVKTLFRFDPEAWKLGIHRPKLKNKVLETPFPGEVHWLNGSGRPMEDYFKFRGWRSIQRTVGYDWVQMNHYAIKSVDAYALRRFRGNVNAKKSKYGADYWALQDRNEVRDDTMLRYAARRRAIFEGLLGDPVLARLHAAATERAEARLDALRAAPGYARFVADLQAAGRTPITAVEAKPPKPRDPERIAAQMSAVEQRVVVPVRVQRSEPHGLPPTDIFVRGVPDLSRDVPLEWHDNHGVAVPADPRLFTPPALSAVAEGKFQRNAARHLPGLVPQGGRYAEWGPACGFLALRLAAERPDVSLCLGGDDPAGRAAAAHLWARAGRDLAAVTTDAPLADLADADVLALAAPGLTAEALAVALDAARPGAVAVVERLWIEAQDRMPALARVLAAHGLTRRLTVDPTVWAVFVPAEDAG